MSRVDNTTEGLGVDIDRKGISPWGTIFITAESTVPSHSLTGQKTGCAEMEKGDCVLFAADGELELRLV
jgi:hypothetical protein